MSESNTFDYSLDLYIEALIFASLQSLELEDIIKTLEESFGQKFEKDFIRENIQTIREKYEREDLAIQLVEIANGYSFMTKPKYHKLIGDYLKLSEKKKLSTAALETLSIIAYKQPISKSEIESIRGVNSDYTVQKLLEKDLVEIGGRLDTPGRPLVYITTEKFLNHFGLKNVKDLPKLKEIETVEHSVGNISELAE